MTAASMHRDAEASKRGRANRNKGASFERVVAKWLREQTGFTQAERGVRNGWRTSGHHSHDPFDIVGTPGVLWSLKDTDVSEEQVHRWLHEVDAHARERGLVGVLVWKRKGASAISRQWAYRRIEVAGLLVSVRMHLYDLVDILEAEGYGEPSVTP